MLVRFKEMHYEFTSIFKMGSSLGDDFVTAILHIAVPVYMDNRQLQINIGKTLENQGSIWATILVSFTDYHAHIV